MKMKKVYYDIKLVMESEDEQHLGVARSEQVFMGSNYQTNGEGQEYNEKLMIILSIKVA